MKPLYDLFVSAGRLPRPLATMEDAWKDCLKNQICRDITTASSGKKEFPGNSEIEKNEHKNS